MALQQTWSQTRVSLWTNHVGCSEARKCGVSCNKRVGKTHASHLGKKKIAFGGNVISNRFACNNELVVVSCLPTKKSKNPWHGRHGRPAQDGPGAGKPDSQPNRPELAAARLFLVRFESKDNVCVCWRACSRGGRSYPAQDYSSAMVDGGSTKREKKKRIVFDS